MAIIETAENAKEELLQTHYYKASYEELKKIYLEALKVQKHKVLSVNDDYGEIFSEIPNFTVTAKIIMQNPKESSIDFYIDSEFMIGSAKKAKQFISEVLEKIGKHYEFKGISLHV